MDDFHDKFVPKKYMPSNYGGELPSTSELNGKLQKKNSSAITSPVKIFIITFLAEFRQRFQNVKEWFAEFDSKDYYVDETKRPKSSQAASAMIGSFRQLDID